MSDFDPQWVIDDSTPIEHQAINGIGHGMIPRNLDVQPPYGASPTEIVTYPRVEWPERIKDKIASGSRNSDIRNRGGPDGGPIPYLNQSSFPYCWRHSAVHSVMLARAKMGLPYVALSAFSVCPTVHSGGWAALAYDYIMKFGASPQSLWPQGKEQMSLWTPECQTEAAKNKIAEGWWDAGIYPGLRKLTFDQVVTQLLDGTPTPVEFNWWGHSVLGLDIVEVDPSKDLQDPNRWAIDILNSWINYGVNGVGRIVGKKAIPDTSVSLTAMQPI